MLPVRKFAPLNPPSCGRDVVEILLIHRKVHVDVDAMDCRAVSVDLRHWLLLLFTHLVFICDCSKHFNSSTKSVMFRYVPTGW